MPLAPGTRLGPYEILSPLGAGGPRAPVLFAAGDNVIFVSPTPDHQRFLATIRSEVATAPAIVADLNWTAALAKS